MRLLFCELFLATVSAVMRYLIRQWSFNLIIFLFQLYEVSDFVLRFLWCLWFFFIAIWVCGWKLEWFLFHCAYWFLTICVALKRMNRIAMVMLHKNFSCAWLDPTSIVHKDSTILNANAFQTWKIYGNCTIWTLISLTILYKQMIILIQGDKHTDNVVTIEITFWFYEWPIS